MVVEPRRYLNLFVKGIVKEGVIKYSNEALSREGLLVDLDEVNGLNLTRHGRTSH